MATILRRPEGLSPCYYSMISPDIEDSLFFKAEFRSSLKGDKPTHMRIKLYDSDGDEIKTYTHTITTANSLGGNIYSVSTSSAYADFEENEDYYWTAEFKNSEATWSDISVKAKFVYKRCEGVEPIVWEYRAKRNDVVIRETVFEEIRKNILILIQDYGDSFDDLADEIGEMFAGEITPSKEDFKTLDKVLNTIGADYELFKKLDAIQKVEDSLGESDIKAVQDFIDELLRKSPQPVTTATITVPTPIMYDMEYLDADSSGVKDKTVQVSWGADEPPKQTGNFKITNIGKSKDLRYLMVNFSYGPTTGNGYNIRRFTSELYFHIDDVTSSFVRTFTVDWAGLYTATYLDQANHQLDIYSVDKRGNVSSSSSVIKTYSNLKPALGVSSYEVDFQRLDTLTGKTPNKTGSWSNFYDGSAEKKTHTLSEKLEGTIFYRARAVDKSGAKSDWTYSDPVRYDPLDPPLPPKNFRSTGSTKTTIEWAWDASKNATSYEFRKTTSSGNTYSGKNRKVTTSGHTKNTKYTYYVRAVNSAGKSAWVSATGKTKLGKTEATFTATSSNSWRTSTAWTFNNDGWYKKSDSRYGRVYQGEWKNGWSGPNYLYQYPSRAVFGKHKGLWFFDYNDIKNRLKDKKILSVKFRVTRKGYQHGVYKDQQPTFWLHNYASQPSGQPKFLDKKYKSEVKFDLGETGYVNLPISFINEILKGNAKGIGTYANGNMLPYTQFTPNGRFIVTYTDED